MSELPPRPPEIPAQAVWSSELELWEVPASAGAAAELRRYRPDGTLYLISATDESGAQHGPFTLFHRDGRVAREGRYERGAIHGLVVAYAPEAEDGEPLRGCCVPDGARMLKAEYDRGNLVYERFFDGQARVLLSDGRVAPERPPSLPERAYFEESEDRWAVPPESDPDSTWSFHDQQGVLVEEARFKDGLKCWSRLHASDGGVREEVHLNREGRRHGAFRRRFVDGVASPYLDARIVEERGELVDDQPVGPWTFHDTAGQVIRAVEHGRALPADTPGHPVFANETRLPEAWAEMAERLFAEGQPAQALAAVARAAARRGEAGELIAELARHSRPLTPAEAESVTERAIAVEAEPIPALLSALVSGGEPAALFRALATAQRDSPHAGRDFADAAILLAPDRPLNYLTRALLRLELGDERGALSDADRAGAASPESRQFVRDYARLLLPEWGFSPARHAGEFPAGPMEGIPDAPCQDVAAIRHVLGVYATRLGILREAIVRLVPRRSTAGFIPPALPQLLPAGPVTLRRETATIVDETDAGPETSSVEIDETLDAATAGLPSLMRVARGQWAALTWLCWSCGLDRVALPESVQPRPEFPAAAAAAITRFFRAQDVLITGGMRSQTAGVPSFVWEGMDLDEMPRPFVQLAVDEYYELRALFLWLLSPENLSPFQSDLREVG